MFLYSFMPLDCLRGHSMLLGPCVGRYAPDFDMIYALGLSMGTRDYSVTTIGRFGFDLYPWIVYGNASDGTRSHIG